MSKDTKKFVGLGSIAVVPIGTENPYRNGIAGIERSNQLGKFFRNLPTPEYEFWYAPVEGGAKKIVTSKDVNLDPEEVDYYWDEQGFSK